MEGKNMQFKDRDLTRLALNDINSIDYDAEEIFDKGIPYLEMLANSNFFLDSLKKYIYSNRERLNFCGNIDADEDIRALVKKCYADAGLVGDKGKGEKSYNPQTIKSWLEGKRMPTREEALRFCLCLKMNTVDATEFLLKGCLMKPFNFKDIFELVIYYCLNNEKDYQKALDIMEALDVESADINPHPENDTLLIKQEVENITDEETLIKYLRENREGFKLQSRKAIELLKKYIDDIVELAEWERMKYFKDYGIPKIKSKNDISAILNVILGYETRANEKGNAVYKKKINNSRFPEAIKRNFPQPQQIVSVLKDSEPSVETLRKTLVLVVFYNMFATCDKEGIDDTDGEYFAQFVDEVDDVLGRCGYVQMYWRNPYDWMMGYCARADRPLDEFRELIGYYYLDDDEIYS